MYARFLLSTRLAIVKLGIVRKVVAKTKLEWCSLPVDLVLGTVLPTSFEETMAWCAGKTSFADIDTETSPRKLDGLQKRSTTVFATRPHVLVSGMVFGESLDLCCASAVIFSTIPPRSQ